ncbi:MAG TPA: radical SAM protein [Candidatus Acidoferrales bacterium]|nr:radical SAM protein [Candidatus Acidoferrales bacterium]
MTLMAELIRKAAVLGVPLSVHVDLTYRCNERCEHCYLDHEDKGELTFAEFATLFEQLADAGVFFLTLSGGEPMVRRDFFDIVARARALQFNVKVKTNAVLIRQAEAQRLRALGVEQMQVSVYSHRPEVHDAVTKLPGSLGRTLDGIRALRGAGLKVAVSNVMMRSNLADRRGVAELARRLGVTYTADPTITPMMDGDRGVLDLRIDGAELTGLFRDKELVGDPDSFCTPPPPVGDDELNAVPCSAGHSACYVSPYGDVYPCVQFPLPTGNVRRQRFIDIWRDSPQLREVRSIHTRDLPVCSSCAHLGTCTRCPGLAWTEGNMRGPSSADCEKSFYRTGVPSANMLRRGLVTFPSGIAETALGAYAPGARPALGLVQIAPLPQTAA